MGIVSTVGSQGSALKRAVIGWFTLQCWLTALVSIGGILLVSGTFGEGRAQATLRFLRDVSGIFSWAFPNATMAAVVLGAVTVLSFIVRYVIEKILFQIIVLTVLAFVIIWTLIRVGPYFAS